MRIGDFTRDRLIAAMDEVRAATEDVRNKLDNPPVVDYTFAAELEQLEGRLKQAAHGLEQLRKEIKGEE